MSLLYTSLEGDGSDGLADSIKTLTNLTSLNLDMRITNLHDTGLAKISTALAALTKLTSLVLSMSGNSAITSTQGDILAGVIGSLSHLSSFAIGVDSNFGEILAFAANATYPLAMLQGYATDPNKSYFGDAYTAEFFSSYTGNSSWSTNIAPALAKYTVVYLLTGSVANTDLDTQLGALISGGLSGTSLTMTSVNASTQNFILGVLSLPNLTSVTITPKPSLTFLTLDLSAYTITHPEMNIIALALANFTSLTYLSLTFAETTANTAMGFASTPVGKLNMLSGYANYAQGFFYVATQAGLFSDITSSTSWDTDILPVLNDYATAYVNSWESDLITLLGDITASDSTYTSIPIAKRAALAAGALGTPSHATFTAANTASLLTGLTTWSDINQLFNNYKAVKTNSVNDLNSILSFSSTENKRTGLADYVVILGLAGSVSNISSTPLNTQLTNLITNGLSGTSLTIEAPALSTTPQQTNFMMALNNLPHLTSVNITGTSSITTLTPSALNGITPAGLNSISLALANFTELTILNLTLTNNALNDASVSTLATTIERLTKLTSLNLGLASTDIGNIALTALWSAAHNLTSLTTLTLGLAGNTSISNTGAIALSYNLSNLSALRTLKLYLNGTSIGDAGASAIGTSLSSLSDLTSLDLRLANTSVHNTGADALAENIARLTSITNLNSTTFGTDINATTVLGFASSGANKIKMLDGYAADVNKSYFAAANTAGIFEDLTDQSDWSPIGLVLANYATVAQNSSENNSSDLTKIVGFTKGSIQRTALENYVVLLVLKETPDLTSAQVLSDQASDAISSTISFTMTSFEMAGKNTSQLGAAVARLQSLTTLNLDFSNRNAMTDTDMSNIANGIQRLTSLTSLNLNFEANNGSTFTDTGLASLATALGNLTNLTALTLNLSNTNMTNTSSSSSNIGIALTNLTKLASLNLNFSGSRMTDAQAGNIITGFRPSITSLTLNLVGTKVTNATVTAIKNALSSSLVGLDIDLGYSLLDPNNNNYFGGNTTLSNDVTSITNALTNFTSLTSFGLGVNGSRFTNANVITILTQVNTSCTGLTSLRLGLNSSGVTQESTIFAYISTNLTSLTSLSLDLGNDNFLSSSDTTNISDMLTSLTSLTTLNLGFGEDPYGNGNSNTVGDGDVASILDSIPGSVTSLTLDLSFITGIIDHSSESLGFMNSLKAQTQLTSLNLNFYNGMLSDTSIEYLGTALSSLTSLKSLTLYFSGSNGRPTSINYTGISGLVATLQRFLSSLESINLNFSDANIHLIMGFANTASEKLSHVATYLIDLRTHLDKLSQYGLTSDITATNWKSITSATLIQYTAAHATWGEDLNTLLGKITSATDYNGSLPAAKRAALAAIYGETPSYTTFTNANTAFSITNKDSLLTGLTTWTQINNILTAYADASTAGNLSQVLGFASSSSSSSSLAAYQQAMLLGYFADTNKTHFAYAYTDEIFTGLNGTWEKFTKFTTTFEWEINIGSALANYAFVSGHNSSDLTTILGFPPANRRTGLANYMMIYNSNSSNLTTIMGWDSYPKKDLLAQYATFLVFQGTGPTMPTTGNPPTFDTQLSEIFARGLTATTTHGISSASGLSGKTTEDLFPGVSPLLAFNSSKFSVVLQNLTSLTYFSIDLSKLDIHEYDIIQIANALKILKSSGKLDSVRLVVPNSRSASIVSSGILVNILPTGVYYG
jgi:hypothetical protein